MVFYEAPHRICATLAAMSDTFGASREAVFARELTKRFETLLEGDLSTLHEQVSSDNDQQKGEGVIVVTGYRATADLSAQEAEAEKMLRVLLSELSITQAARLVARLTSIKKNQAYQLALRIQEENDEH